MFKQLTRQHVSRRHNKRARSAAAKPAQGRRLRMEHLEDRRLLAVFSVTNLDDSGSGSLRDAITMANSTPGADEIDFSVNGTIDLASQLPTVTDALTVTGPGANLLTIDAGGGTDGSVGNHDGFRIFDIDDGSASLIEVNVSGLTLTGGDQTGVGGAIRNSENLTVTNSSISSNAAQFGGGIDNTGTLTVSGSTFSDNSASFDGGGIGNAGTTNVTNSTFSHNMATNLGGGISNPFATLNVETSTFAGNTADTGPGIRNFSSSTATINNSIIADGISSAGTLTGNYNLFVTGSDTTNGANDITVADAAAVNLGPLADNGGPTQTHALLVGSPALDAGNSTLTTDQRGLTRPVDHPNVVNAAGGNGADMGAVEQEEFASLIVTTVTDAVDATDFLTSLREAIAFANSQSGSDTVTFDAALSGQTISLSGTELGISDTLAIDASALVENVTIDAQQNSRVLRFAASTGDLTLNNLTLTGGRVPGSSEDGGGIRFESGGMLTLTGTTVSGNSAGDDGGGIYTSDGSVSLTNSTVSDNSADGRDGGGIFALSGSVSLTNSTVSANSARDGGGIAAFSSGGSVSLTYSTVSDNYAARRGGGIHTSSGSVSLTNSTVSGNSAASGGGIRTYSGTVSLINSTVSGNSAASGSGIYSGSGSVSLTNSTINGNSARDEGGGIYSGSGSVSLTSSTINGNSARDDGGGIYMRSGSVTLTNSTVSANSASGTGGGISLDPFSGFSTEQLTLLNSIVAGNSDNGTAPDFLAPAGGTDQLNVDFSLIGDNTGTTLTEAQTADARGNLIGTGANPMNPLLGPLADHGGPTQTHALLSGSPAIDAGNSTLATDQRGLPVPFDFPSIPNAAGGNGSDIGSLELQVAPDAPSALVTTVSDASGPFDNQTSLREAIIFVNAGLVSGPITFNSLFDTPQTINLTSQLPTITSAMTITGPGANLLTLDAGGGTDGSIGNLDGFRVFNIDDGTASMIDVNLSGLSLTGGDQPGVGGAIRNVENLTVTSSTISSNAAQFGGGIDNAGALTVRDSTFSENLAASDGGGIGNAGTTNVTGSTFSNNTATNLGGGIFNPGATLNVHTSTFAANTANTGPGIRNFSSSTATLHNSIIADGISNDGTLAGNYNLFVTGGDTTNGANDIAVADAAAVNLGPLADNGGPTQTHALLVGSPALDAGNSTLTTDQRGLTRPVDHPSIPNAAGGNGADIGAFERQTEIPSLGVTTSDDVVDDTDLMTSLREAIAFANSQSGADTITFDPTLFGTTQTILLGSQLPTITDALTIDGPGANLLTLDAGNGTDNTLATGDGFRIFHIDDGTGTSIDVNLSGVTLTGGDLGNNRVGGALLNHEHLTIADATISGNAAEGNGGGIHNVGTLNITSSTISGNRTQDPGGGFNGSGGGIANLGALDVNTSTVSDNTSSRYGGGIHNTVSGIATIANSTISGNVAVRGGGAIANIQGGTVNLTNSTLSANQTGADGGGIYSISATTTIASSTITDNSAALNGGGIGTVNSTTNVDNSIVAGNMANNGANVDGTLTTNTFNLIDGNAMLGPLADNGGPTQTHALLVGSPALDAGNSTLTTDQRGFTRPIDHPNVANAAGGNGADIGAFERQTEILSLIVTTNSDAVDNTDFVTSLREAIALANSQSGSDTITFDPALSGQTISLGGAELAISETLTIDASALAESVTVDAQQNSRVLRFTAGTGDLTLNNLTLTGGRTADAGGGIRFDSSGMLSLTGSTVSGNETVGGAFTYGGGIFLYSGSVSLTNSIVSGNSSSDDGGGMFARTGSVSLTNSTVSGNSAGDAGGGIRLVFGEMLSLNSSTVSGNSADDAGGGIYAFSGSVSLTDSTVSGNSAGDDGGGIFGGTGSVSLTNSTVSGNSTVREGGGISTDSASVTLANSTLSGNSAGQDGGGVYTFSGNVSLTNSTVGDNSAAGTGGGISLDERGYFSTEQLTLVNSIVVGNSDNGTAPDFLAPAGGTDQLSVDFSLIGDNTGTTLAEAQTADPRGNLIGTGANPINPLLGPLADNGGPTQTHALLPGSPALNAGDPGAVAGQNGVPLFDQRGPGFDRVVGGRMDMGSFESQTAPIGCDFDADTDCDILDIDLLVAEIAAGTNNPAFDLTGDMLVDLADRDEWLALAGGTNLPSGNPYLVGDANLDGVVDGQDFIVWNSNKFTSTGLWSQADWNADGMTDGQDFLLWNANKFLSADAPASPSSGDYRLRDIAINDLFHQENDDHGKHTNHDDLVIVSG